MVKLLKDLPIGSLVKDKGTAYRGHDIVWVVLDHDHEGYPSGSTTLLSKYGLDNLLFDNAEYFSYNNDIKEDGNSRYDLSNIRQWMNKYELDWYEPTHKTDSKPYTNYDGQAGFLSNFTEDFDNNILKTTVMSLDYEGKPRLMTDKIFLLSASETGLKNLEDGIKFKYFDEGDLLELYPTKELCSRESYFEPNKSVKWWTRTSYQHFLYPAKVLTCNTFREDDTEKASAGLVMFRPALNIKSDLLVSDQTDSDGNYIIMWNQPPSIPEKIIVNEPVVSNNYVLLQWEESIDPEGDDVSYILEKKSDNGAWKQIYQGKDASNWSWTAPTESKVQYRVKAYDIHGNESGWKTSDVSQVIHNRPPKISGNDSDLGLKDKGFTLKYTVTDEDKDKVKVVIKLDGEVIYSNDDHKLGEESSIVITDEDFLSISSNEHVILITATDIRNDSDTRKYTFRREVNESTVTLKEPLHSEQEITKAIMSMNRKIPDEVEMQVLVTNNSKDSNPVWIDVTDNVIKGKKIFFDTNTNSHDFNFKISIKRLENGEPAFIRSVSGNFE